MFYFSKAFYSYSPWSATSISPTEDQDSSSKDIQEDYCMIKCTTPTSVHATLSLINAEPVNWHSKQDLLNELTIVHDNLHNTCHQFDQSRITEQFSSTHLKIGTELKSYIQFISDRYSQHTWLALIALAMIGFEVLMTPTQVKKELIHVTRIGRHLALTMHRLLLHQPEEESFSSDIHFDDAFKSNLLNIFVTHNQKDDWFSLLKNVCFEFSRHDKDWEFNSNYHEIVSMATYLVLV